MEAEIRHACPSSFRFPRAGCWKVQGVAQSVPHLIDHECCGVCRLQLLASNFLDFQYTVEKIRYRMRSACIKLAFGLLNIIPTRVCDTGNRQCSGVKVDTPCFSSIATTAHYVSVDVAS